jgi:hypothetical protein
LALAQGRLWLSSKWLFSTQSIVVLVKLVSRIHCFVGIKSNAFVKNWGHLEIYFFHSGKLQFAAVLMVKLWASQQPNADGFFVFEFFHKMGLTRLLNSTFLLLFAHKMSFFFFFFSIESER